MDGGDAWSAEGFETPKPVHTARPGSQLESETDPGLERIGRGKVRDLYRLDPDRLLLVASDRLSAFDVVFREPIPGKGRILTDLSRFWFEATAEIIPNHCLAGDWETRVRTEAWDYLQGRTLLVRRLNPLPIEAVVRGYLAGSAWKSYQQGEPVSGMHLPPGLREAERLETPLYTPTSKAPIGEHDRPLSFDETVERIGSGALAEAIREHALAIYRLATKRAEACGLIIADTKMEFGTNAAGELFLIDELLTPDSTRFWPRDTFEPGRAPPSFDKQFVRDYLESIGWNKQPPPPPLPAPILEGTRARYEEARQRLLGPIKL
ncbi:phosphoribosylaminoimidazole-succinocarboxamide synthase [mine drainage metagenome]|uniref:phosphoribosylaminoimidazolesuccinocarboxamide synthase n=1 Tax=mine drainage metagenome TaxID=410659 RepID=T1BIX3_9ZZZZ